LLNSSIIDSQSKSSLFKSKQICLDLSEKNTDIPSWIASVISLLSKDSFSSLNNANSFVVRLESVTQLNVVRILI
jgi:hypothetical protein